MPASGVRVCMAVAQGAAVKDLGVTPPDPILPTVIALETAAPSAAAGRVPCDSSLGLTWDAAMVIWGGNYLQHFSRYTLLIHVGKLMKGQLKKG